MTTYRTPPPADPRSKGIIAFFSVVLLVCLALVCLAHYSETSLSLAQAGNQRATCDARMAAENGLAFMLYTIRTCTDITGASRGQMLFDSLEYNLNEALLGTENLGGKPIARVNNRRLVLPPITVEPDRWFEAEMEFVSHDTMRLTVTGFARNGAILTVSRKISLDFQPQWEEALGYGVTSKGPITFSQNTQLVGAKNPTDGSIYSALTNGQAVSIASGTVSGSINVTTPTVSVYTGSTVVNGGVNRDASPIAMPAVDRSPYLDAIPKNALGLPAFSEVRKAANGKIEGGTYQNLIIRKGTFPTFESDVTIEGVLYIESPNYVTFNGNGNIFTCIIVGEAAANSSDLNTNRVTFKNNTILRSVDELPDMEPFQKIRKFANVAVIAPDFGFHFQNNMQSVSGLMAVRDLTVKNNGTTAISGSILAYGQLGVTFNNNSTVTIKLSTTPPPPGFKGHGLPPLVPVPATYIEW